MLKLGFRLSIGVEHHVFVIPWVKRHYAPRILCSEQRDYSSSGMIRYVPKKSQKISEDLTSQPVGSSETGIYARRLDPSVLGSQVNGESKEDTEGTFLDRQDKNYAGGYVNESCNHDSSDGIMSLETGINASRLGSKEAAGEGTFFDLQEKHDAGLFMDVSCDDSRQELEESSDEVKSTRQHRQAYDKVKLHMEVKQAKSNKEACKTTQEAENMAIRYLGLRAYSTAELKKKLIGKKYPLEIIDRVISDFQIRGFINDGLYAESFSRSRWSSLSWGPRRIKQALYKKGISNKDSETAIKLVFEKSQCTEGDEEEEAKHGMSKEAMDQLYVQASKRWLQGRDLPTETRKARVIRWLQYRGFNWGVVSKLVKRLDSTHES